MEIRVASLLNVVSKSSVLATDARVKKLPPLLTNAYIVNNCLVNVNSISEENKCFMIQKLDVYDKNTSNEEFSFCPSKLANILKLSNPDDKVEIYKDDEKRSVFKIGRATFALSGCDISDDIREVNINDIDESNSVEVSTDDFFDIISQSMKFINLKDGRQRLHGMYFDRSNGFINTYVCNGHSVYNGQFKADIEPGKNFIHRNVMKSLNGMKKYIDKMTIVFTQYETIFKSSDMIYYNKVSDIAMPNFLKVIGCHQDSRFDILTKDIDKIKKFIKPLAKNEDTTKEPNFLRFNGYINNLTVSGKCESSSAFNGFSCSFEEPLEITKDFNYKSVSDILSCFKKEATIKLHNDKLIVEDRLRTIVLLGLK